ncbi:MAG TPA: hypothetical protein DCR55_14675 [Lentisphaeria bacterium]|nr:hypothetical protein [Lentisphaeria bacterium]
MRWRRYLITGCVAAVVVAGLGLWLGPKLVPFRLGCLAETATVYRDRHGTEIYGQLASNGGWRLPVPLAEIPVLLQQGIIAVEDKRFWQHSGVDVWAVGRALLGNLYNGRINSGASTISMQLARMAVPEPRSYLGKLRQTLRALDLERRYSKEWILEHYLNSIPMGANLLGAEAASRCYFAKSASELTDAEATLLAGLPQRPTAFRPDRHLRRARRRQGQTLRSLVETGMLTQKAAAAIAKRPIRVASLPAGISRVRTPQTDLVRKQYCARQQGAGPWIDTPLDPQVETVVRTALKRAVRRLPGVKDGAAVVIDLATSGHACMVGTLYSGAITNSRVNAAVRPRSPGSALKPFLYLQALDLGMITPASKLLDAPLRYGTYQPHNFAGETAGWVTATEALCSSLNLPAIRLHERLGTASVQHTFTAYGLPHAPASQTGLTLALGGAEISLVNLTESYAALANGLLPASLDACAQLQHMLTRPVPGCEHLDLPWKTGTSNGHRDAWCVGWTDRYAIGVWLGNKSGRPARALVGTTAAAPVWADVVAALHPQGGAPESPAVVTRSVCEHTGLLPRRDCTSSTGTVGRGAIRYCPGTCQQADERTPIILSPSRSLYQAPEGEVVLDLRVSGLMAGNWYVNGRPIGEGQQQHSFGPGKHHIVCLFANGSKAATTIRVRS